MQMDKEQYGQAKACLISCMQEGHSWQVAKAQAGLQISQSNAYRLWRAFRLHGEAALSDGRHGHPSKLREAARAFLEERCQQAPQTPSSTIQMELQKRFDLHVSISQINRVRAALGMSNHSTCPALGEKKAGEEGASSQPEWQEGAGSLLLLASAHQTGLRAVLQTALSPSHLTIDPSLRLAHHQPATLCSQLLTLLFLETVGLRRTWDLRGYTGQALALLTGRRRAYGYRHAERFLAELSRSGADVPLTEALARWAAPLWKPKSQGREALFPSFTSMGIASPSMLMR